MIRSALTLLLLLVLPACKQATGPAPSAAAASPAPPSSPAPPAFGELSVEEVAARLGKPNVYVFDNNVRDRWVKGHVPGARWVNPRKLTAADLPADKEATLIFYCANEH